jgi:ribonuclease P protein component
MLKKANRLAKDRDIQKTFARGRAFFSPFFSVKFLPGGTNVRFTVVVSTKVSKRAVVRNRLKRLVREYLRTHLPDFKNGDHVLSVKPKAVTLPENQLIPNLITLFGKK